MKIARMISLVGVAALLMLAGFANAKSDKEYVCHKEDGSAANTLRISVSAVPAHLGHGDYLGKCGDVPPPPREVAMLRCLADSLTTPITVSSLSATEGAPEIEADPTPGVGDSCAEAVASLLDDGFMLHQVFADDAGGLATFYLLVR